MKFFVEDAGGCSVLLRVAARLFAEPLCLLPDGTAEFAHPVRVSAVCCIVANTRFALPISQYSSNVQ